MQCVVGMIQNELRRSVRRRCHYPSGNVSTNQRVSDRLFRLGWRGRRHGLEVLHSLTQYRLNSYILNE